MSNALAALFAAASRAATIPRVSAPFHLRSDVDDGGGGKDFDAVSADECGFCSKFFCYNATTGEQGAASSETQGFLILLFSSVQFALILILAAIPTVLIFRTRFAAKEKRAAAKAQMKAEAQRIREELAEALRLQLLQSDEPAAASQHPSSADDDGLVHVGPPATEQGLHVHEHKEIRSAQKKYAFTYFLPMHLGVVMITLLVHPLHDLNHSYHSRFFYALQSYIYLLHIHALVFLCRRGHSLEQRMAVSHQREKRIHQGLRNRRSYFLLHGMFVQMKCA